jgi:hypothetical protein
VVVHPLATLATDDLPSLFDQVVLLVKNTGSTFASTELVFRAFPGDDIVLETDDEDEENGEGDGLEGDEGEDGEEGDEGDEGGEGHPSER